MLLLSVPIRTLARDLEIIQTKSIDGLYMGVAAFGGAYGFFTNNIPTTNQLVFGIWRTSTNNHAVVYVPVEPEYAYHVELLDTGHIAVAKTERGKKVGTTFNGLDASFSNAGAKLQKLPVMDRPGFGGRFLFRPDDFFEIKKPGNYNLRIRFQIIARTVSGTNDTRRLIRFRVMEVPLVESGAPSKRH
jgi:hypothetical protein